ncbi:CoA pyrophosphatase [Shewanella litorisediminis]|uniref:CoA pyrophosphatase n=1 Tax=Shewanella litorisediminis TaxID=1173586 RepID=A0ABX7G853_9GAMM|nr:CoA pyrophosphatase [Shewanella litorisediminis]MCL2919138.1 CoA pyrophosphatase [Shewanella litorisediminis]QRH03387.1 CoA pyrophosphatase [Shewanella litorisediminis]
MPFTGAGAISIEELRLHFSLQPLRHAIVSAPLKTRVRQAAVLMALEELNGELQLILTTRPTHLKAHPGQVSFPGGKVEPSDVSPTHTAFREAEEEIGLQSENLELLGQFPTHRTFTGFEITPVLALVKDPFELRIDPGEVAECFRVPLRFFMQDKHRHTRQFQRQGHSYQVVFIPWEGRLIWGATAAMIDLLCRHLKDGGAI